MTVERHPNDGTVWTVPGPDGKPLRCTKCGCFVEVLWEDRDAYRLGHAMPLCADDRGDRRVLLVLNPPSVVVERRRREHEEQYRREAAERPLRRVA